MKSNRNFQSFLEHLVQCTVENNVADEKVNFPLFLIRLKVFNLLKYLIVPDKLKYKSYEQFIMDCWKTKTLIIKRKFHNSFIGIKKKGNLLPSVSWKCLE